MTNTANPLKRLGAVRVSDFLARYWQREVLCVREAIADFASPVTPSRLFALARDPRVESRLVSAFAGRWKLRPGPIPKAALPPLGRPGWTLLVQGVDLHDAAVWSLAARFRFLPAACFDDVMISFASDGGGVGPHVDQYDVFLLQAQGRRRWRVATEFDPQPLAGVPLRLLAKFRHEHEWVLEPGDLLYLPPGVAHEGVALGQSITISIGFRVPARQEILEAWYDYQTHSAPRIGYLAERARSPRTSPARLPSTLVQSALRELRRAQPGRSDVRRALLEHLSEPKPAVVFARRRAAADRARFAAAARRRGLLLDMRTRMLYAGAHIAINGEIQPQLPREARNLLHRLADRQQLAAGAFDGVGAASARALLSLFHEWYRSGWLHLAAK